MSRVGAAGDHAAREPFFDLLQANVLERQRWTTREDLAVAVITWLETTYDRRRQRALGTLTPHGARRDEHLVCVRPFLHTRSARTTPTNLADDEGTSVPGGP